METTVNVKFLDGAYEDVELSADDGELIFLTQDADVIVIPLEEAVEFAEALKAWAEQQR